MLCFSEPQRGGNGGGGQDRIDPGLGQPKLNNTGSQDSVRISVHLD